MIAQVFEQANFVCSHLLILFMSDYHRFDQSMQAEVQAPLGLVTHPDTRWNNPHVQS